MYVEMLSRMGHASNDEALAPWAERIGRLVLNFGGIELLTYKYLALIEPDRGRLERCFELLLVPRIDRIIQLLAANEALPDAERQIANRDWGEVKKMTQWRNHIAHNPVVPFWGTHQDPSREPPEGIVMPDVRDLPTGRMGVEVTLELLDELVAVSAILSRRLSVTADSFRPSEQRQASEAQLDS